MRRMAETFNPLVPTRPLFQNPQEDLKSAQEALDNLLLTVWMAQSKAAAARKKQVVAEGEEVSVSAGGEASKNVGENGRKTMSWVSVGKRSTTLVAPPPLLQPTVQSQTSVEVPPATSGIASPSSSYGIHRSASILRSLGLEQKEEATVTSQNPIYAQELTDTPMPMTSQLQSAAALLPTPLTLSPPGTRSQAQLTVCPLNPPPDSFALSANVSSSQRASESGGKLKNEVAEEGVDMFLDPVDRGLLPEIGGAPHFPLQNPEPSVWEAEGEMIGEICGVTEEEGAAAVSEELDGEEEEDAWLMDVGGGVEDEEDEDQIADDGDEQEEDLVEFMEEEEEESNLPEDDDIEEIDGGYLLDVGDGEDLEVSDFGEAEESNNETFSSSHIELVVPLNVEDHNSESLMDVGDGDECPKEEETQTLLLKQEANDENDPLYAASPRRQGMQQMQGGRDISQPYSPQLEDDGRRADEGVADKNRFLEPLKVDAFKAQLDRHCFVHRIKAEPISLPLKKQQQPQETEMAQTKIPTGPKAMQNVHVKRLREDNPETSWNKRRRLAHPGPHSAFSRPPWWELWREVALPHEMRGHLYSGAGLAIQISVVDPIGVSTRSATASTRSMIALIWREGLGQANAHQNDGRIGWRMKGGGRHVERRSKRIGGSRRRQKMRRNGKTESKKTRTTFLWAIRRGSAVVGVILFQEDPSDELLSQRARDPMVKIPCRLLGF
ncbi:hypothetical protein BT69DRAFT_1323064 [Atractiella rhizophila]|nr:hypothetical protein BT69DRAFT_1323064 [Atractiella rhizophila]